MNSKAIATRIRERIADLENLKSEIRNGFESLELMRIELSGAHFARNELLALLKEIEANG